MAERDEGAEQPRPAVSWRAIPAVALLVTLLVVGADFVFPEPRLFFSDLALQLRGCRPLEPRVALVDIEEWPVPRNVLAAAIDRIGELGPRVIGFDVLLDQVRNPAEDQALAESIEKSGRVILPVDLELGESGQRRPTPLLPEFAKAAAGVGFANFGLDFDGVVRKAHIEHAGPSRGESDFTALFPSFGLTVLQRLLAEDVQPANRELLIDWACVEHDRLPIASMKRLLSDAAYRQGLAEMGFCRDKAVLLAYLGRRNVGDSFLTPFSLNPMDRTPGAVIHANILDNLLTGRRLGQVGGAYVLILSFLFALAGAVAGRGRWMTLAWTAAAAMSAGLFAAEIWLLARWNVVLGALPIAASGLAALALSNLLSAKAVLALPLVRQVAALLGVQEQVEIAVLNIVSDEAPGGGILRYTYQLRHGDGPGAVVTASRMTTLPDSFQSLTRRLDTFIQGGGDLTPAEELAELGKDIRSELLSPQLERDLARLGARHLHIELAGHDLAIPWELAEIDGEPLSQRFGVSRSVLREGGRGLPPVPPVRQKPLQALIVANPWPLDGGWDALPAAEEEARSIAAELEPLKRIRPFGLEVEVLAGERATLETVSARLATGDVDLLHFSGHAVFDAVSEEQLGFVFPEGVLSPALLERTLTGGAAPPVVFANACGSGQTAARPERPTNASSSFAARLSLPSAFFDAGARMYIGCLWAVETRAAAQIAVAFYRHLLGGRSAGQALAKARRSGENRWMTHAAYIMYGDPRLKLVRKAKSD